MYKVPLDYNYWFEWSKNHIDSAIERRDAAFDKLQKLVLWLWGIYTTFAATGFALSDKAIDPTSAIIIGGASALLIVVYWATVWGQMPFMVEFDPRSPTEIMEAYHTVVTVRDRRLRITLSASVLAGAAVVIALLVAGASPPRSTTGLEATGQVVGDKAKIGVTLYVGAETDVTLELYPMEGPGDTVPIASELYRSTKAGIVQTSLTAKMSTKYRIIARWSDGDTERSLAKTLNLASTPSN